MTEDERKRAISHKQRLHRRTRTHARSGAFYRPTYRAPSRAAPAPAGRPALEGGAAGFQTAPQLLSVMRSSAHHRHPNSRAIFRGKTPRQKRDAVCTHCWPNMGSLIRLKYGSAISTVLYCGRLDRQAAARSGL